MEWTCYQFYLFKDILNNLREKIEKLKDKNPDKLKGHLSVKLYVAIIETMKEIKANPEDKKYFLGNILGKNNRGWRRAKEGLPDRYRLFFKFFSQSHEIFFVWINDENTLRKAESKTDCYAIFTYLLNNRTIPSNRNALLEKSNKIYQTRRKTQSLMAGI